jgi:hypothetical protein
MFDSLPLIIAASSVEVSSFYGIDKKQNLPPFSPFLSQSSKREKHNFMGVPHLQTGRNDSEWVDGMARNTHVDLLPLFPLGYHSRSHASLSRLGKVIWQLPGSIPPMRAWPLESRVPCLTVPSGSSIR